MSYIPDAFTDSTPAAAALGQSLYIAFKDHDSDHIYLASTRNPADSSSWRIVDVNSIAASPRSPKDEPAQIRTSHGPGLTSTDNHLWLTFKGHDNPFIWQIALRELAAGTWELLRFDRLDHAQTAQGPGAGGPAMEPTSVGGNMSRRPMVVYRGNRDDGVWIHSYTTRTDSDLQLARTHTDLAPAAAYGTLGSQETYLVAYLARAGQQAMFTHNHRVEPPGLQPGWPPPAPIASYAASSRQPALAVHDGLVFLARKSRSESEHQIGISSWDGNYWVNHGSMPRDVTTDQGPALVSFRNSLYVVYKGHNSNRVWYVESDASRRNVRPAIVVSVSGASASGSSSSWDFHKQVQQCAAAHGYPLTLEGNWTRDKGDLRATRDDTTRVKDKINKLVSQNGGDKGQLSLVLTGKSAGGVLAWDTLRVNFISQFAAFHRVALVLVDAHGSADDDDRNETYSDGQNLWWPSNFPTDRAVFRVYNIYQQKEGLTGANFPDSRVYSNTRLSQGNINHDNIIRHVRTHELITEALNFALTGE